MSRERVVSWLISLALHGILLLLAAFVVFPSPPYPPKFIEVELIKIELPSAEIIPVKRIQQVIPAKPKRTPHLKKIRAYEEKMPGIPHKEHREYKEHKEPKEEGVDYRVDTKEVQQLPAAPPSISQISSGESLVYATVATTSTPAVSADTHGPFFIKGPLGRREIVYQPKPKLPMMFEQEGIKPGEIRLKLWVLPNGRVDRILVLRSSGYVEWDGIVVATAQRWRFSDLPPEVNRVDWGEVTIKTIIR